MCSRGDIARLHAMAIQLANGQVDSFTYKDKWDMVLINARQDTDNYQIAISIMQRGSDEYLSDTFLYSKQELASFIDELEKYKNEYPIIA